MYIFLANVGTIIVSILVLIVVAVASFFIVRAMKGKIELQLTKTGFNSGESVGGTVVLTTKKSLEMRRLFVALVGYQVVEHRESDGDKRTERDEIYRDEVNLEEAQTVPAGFNKSYQFALTGNRWEGAFRWAFDRHRTALDRRWRPSPLGVEGRSAGRSAWRGHRQVEVGAGQRLVGSD